MAVADTAVELETHLVSADQDVRLALFDTDKLTLVNDEFGGSDVDIETIREFTDLRQFDLAGSVFDISDSAADVLAFLSQLMQMMRLS